MPTAAGEVHTNVLMYVKPRQVHFCASPSQAAEDGFEIEATVEAIGQFGEVAMGILDEIEDVIRAGDRRLEIAQG